MAFWSRRLGLPAHVPGYHRQWPRAVEGLGRSLSSHAYTARDGELGVHLERSVWTIESPELLPSVLSQGQVPGLGASVLASAGLGWLDAGSAPAVVLLRRRMACRIWEILSERARREFAPRRVFTPLRAALLGEALGCCAALSVPLADRGSSGLAYGVRRFFGEGPIGYFPGLDVSVFGASVSGVLDSFLDWLNSSPWDSSARVLYGSEHSYLWEFVAGRAPFRRCRGAALISPLFRNNGVLSVQDPVAAFFANPHFGEELFSRVADEALSMVRDDVDRHCEFGVWAHHHEGIWVREFFRRGRACGLGLSSSQSRVAAGIWRDIRPFIEDAPGGFGGEGGLLSLAHTFAQLPWLGGEPEAALLLAGRSSSDFALGVEVLMGTRGEAWGRVLARLTSLPSFRGGARQLCQALACCDEATARACGRGAFVALLSHADLSVRTEAMRLMVVASGRSMKS